MGLRSWLARLAEGAPVPVFPAAGAGAGAALDALRLDPRLRLVDSPREANVLLVAGGVPRRLLRPLVTVHDQLSRPRATVWWPLGAPTARLARRFPGAVVVGEARTGEIAAGIVAVQAALLRGERASDPPVLPDVDPAPWRGEGPYGQGGKGMTGGVPYGRPMATRAPDRDGLELDFLPLRIGPFFPPFPPGLVLKVQLQGDLVQDAKVGENPFRVPHLGGGVADDPFRRAAVQPHRGWGDRAALDRRVLPHRPRAPALAGKPTVAEHCRGAALHDALGEDESRLPRPNGWITPRSRVPRAMRVRCPAAYAHVHPHPPPDAHT